MNKQFEHSPLIMRWLAVFVTVILCLNIDIASAKKERGVRPAKDKTEVFQRIEAARKSDKANFYSLVDSLIILTDRKSLTETEVAEMMDWLSQDWLNHDSIQQVFKFNNIASRLYKRALSHGRSYNFALENVELAEQLAPSYKREANKYLASNYSYWGLENKSLHHYKIAVGFARQMNANAELLEDLWQFGRLLIKYDKTEEALEVLNEAYLMAAEADSLPRSFAEYCMVYTFALNQSGDYEEAVRVAKHGLHRAMEKRPLAKGDVPGGPARKSIKVIARYYANMNNADSSLAYYEMFEKWFEQLPHILMVRAQDYYKFGYKKEAIELMDRAMGHERVKTGQGAAMEIALAASELYQNEGYVDKALASYQLYVQLRDSAEAKQLKRQREIEIENSKYSLNLELDRIELENEKQQASINQQRILLAAGGLGMVLVLVLAVVIYRGKKRSDDLLLNILPYETTQELKKTGHSHARQFNQATVMFTDFKGFTALAEKLSPKELVADIDAAFSAFDRIIEKYGIEKIKTIGDSYMAAGGLPTPNDTHASDVVNAALEIRDFIESGKQKKIDAGLPYFEIRIGIHTGPVVAGIVGVKKFSYDIWGDTVNIASRMESSGERGKVNISQSTEELLESDEHFELESRGKIMAKGKGELEMYFIERKT